MTHPPVVRWIVTGDAALDTFELLHSPSPGSPERNYLASPRREVFEATGGVALLHNLLKKAGCGVDLVEVTVQSELGVACVVESSAKLAEDGAGGVFVSGMLGYRLVPADERSVGEGMTGTPGPVEGLVVDDAGNGLRFDAEAIRAALGAVREHGTVVHKLHWPLSDTGLRGALKQRSDLCRIAVVSADDLRRSDVPLSRRTSWDRVFEDLVKSATDGGHGSALSDLVASYEALVILFSVEAAAIVRRMDDGVKTMLHHVADAAEGDLDGLMRRGHAARLSPFTAGLVRCLSTGSDLSQAVLPALEAVRGYAARSMSIEGGVLAHPGIDPPGPGERTHGVRFVTLALTGGAAREAIRLNKAKAANLAKRIILEGAPAYADMAHIRVSAFVSLDRDEIEGMRFVGDLVRRYDEDPRQKKPLSLAVFGQPGSGKSYGVKQLVPDDRFLEFNLSEISKDALPGVFQAVRDRSLQGAAPMVFFDEFDARDCEMVAQFLAPMQDGKFRDGPRLHPIGRAILVFAGGTAPTLADFTGADQASGRDDGWLRQRKIPDFASRLGGVLEVKGPNKVEADGKSNVHLLRRALLLRYLLTDGAPGLEGPGGQLDVEDAVIDALLAVERYTHGARSIENLLRMSALTPESRRFTRADLPIHAQLALHVDNASHFENLLGR